MGNRAREEAAILHRDGQRDTGYESLQMQRKCVVCQATMMDVDQARLNAYAGPRRKTCSDVCRKRLFDIRRRTMDKRNNENKRFSETNAILQRDAEWVRGHVCVVCQLPIPEVSRRDARTCSPECRRKLIIRRLRNGQSVSGEHGGILDLHLIILMLVLALLMVMMILLP